MRLPQAGVIGQVESREPTRQSEGTGQCISGGPRSPPPTEMLQRQPLTATGEPECEPQTTHRSRKASREHDLPYFGMLGFCQISNFNKKGMGTVIALKMSENQL